MLRPIKRLGQNFLRDPNTIRRIADAVEAGQEDPVIEIGPGTGALTAELLDRYPRLTALEVDERAVDLLRETYPALDVRLADVLETDWSQVSQEKAGRLHVVGNLPYYITSPILFSLFDAFEHIERAVVMMQLEVAERLVAEPRTKAYGILSVVTQLYTQPSVLFRVSRHVFYPKPDVTSAVVALAFDPEPAWASEVDPAWLRRVIRQAFNMRRKTLRNSLKPLGRAVPEAFSRRRAEELTPGAFVELAALLV